MRLNNVFIQLLMICFCLTTVLSTIEEQFYICLLNYSLLILIMSGIQACHGSHVRHTSLTWEPWNNGVVVIIYMICFAAFNSVGSSYAALREARGGVIGLAHKPTEVKLVCRVEPETFKFTPLASGPQASPASCCWSVCRTELELRRHTWAGSRCSTFAPSSP